MTKNNLLLAREWFKKAEDDFKSAKVVLEEGGYYGTSCFLAQQIVEKYLKGYLIASGKKLEKIHDLIKLLNECKKIDSSFADWADACIQLNVYYVETRYPLDTPIDYSKKEARESLVLVEMVKEFVLGKLI